MKLSELMMYLYLNREEEMEARNKRQLDDILQFNSEGDEEE